MKCLLCGTNRGLFSRRYHNLCMRCEDEPLRTFSKITPIEIKKSVKQWLKRMEEEE